MTNGKATLTEKDVRKFAKEHGLPAEYARPFFSGLQRSSGSKQIDFHVFSKFVIAREQALRKVFDTLDKGAAPSMTCRAATLRPVSHSALRLCTQQRQPIARRDAHQPAASLTPPLPPPPAVAQARAASYLLKRCASACGT